MCQFDSTLTFDLCGGVQNILEKTQDCKIPHCMYSKLHPTVCKQPKVHSNSCKDSREIRYITNQSDEKCRKECKFIQDRNSEAYRDACSRIASTLPGKQITSSQPPYPNHTIQGTEASSPIHSAVNPETQDTSSRPSTRPSPDPFLESPNPTLDLIRV
ncbi:hypothetical protein PNOK_0803700 [Pyrrhoderma noxium]|uniref:Uncharacterized protein n=1 Tax=Pyrrhoderma noxium TaxID=2282107 RepID=A0A286UA20_9AGAM|nr:hypothetical protein PNOK_0803700 [Pyrrhoderma noxium]